MADSCGKKKQNDIKEKLVDKAITEEVSLTLQEESLVEQNKSTTSLNTSLNESQKRQEEENVDEPMEEAILESMEATSSTVHENKPSNSAECLAKRSKSKDHIDNTKDSCNDSDSDSCEDSSKRQKLNEQQPNTSTSDTRSDSQDVPNFKYRLKKPKERNYRNQNDSSDLREDSSEHDSAPEVSSSSNSTMSWGFYEGSNDTVGTSDTGSEPLQDNNDSNDWTTASETDTDGILKVLQKEPSKSNWSIVKDVVDRQMGFNNSIPCRFYGSLHAVQRLELMYKLEDHIGCVNALGFNQKGNLLASASDDLKVTIWDWAIGKKRIAFHSGHRSNVFQSKWLPLDVENTVITCARDGQIRLIDIQSKVTRKLAQHRAPCHKLSTHLDLPHIVLSAGEDSKVLLIDTRESKATKLLSVKDNDREMELYSIHSNPLNNFEFCVAGLSNFVKIYDRRKLSDPLHQLCPEGLLSNDRAQITCAVYNHNGTEIIASYNNDDIYLFDVASSYKCGDFAHIYEGHRNTATIKGVNFFGPNSEFILSGSDCGNIFIWDKKSEAIVQWMPGDEQGVVNALEPHPHIPILATSGLDYDVKIWIPSREETPNIKQKLQSCIKKNMSARTKNAVEEEIIFDGNAVLSSFLIMLRHAEESRHLDRRSLGNHVYYEGEVGIDDDSSSNSNYSSSVHDSSSESSDC